MAEAANVLLAILGTLEARVDGEPLPALPTLGAQALLVYLNVERILRQPVHRREFLAELLWPDVPSQSARRSLRTSLYYVRQAIPDAVGVDGQPVPILRTDRQTAQIDPDYALQLDRADFLRLIDGSSFHQRQAVKLYRGDILSNFMLDDARPFMEWVTARREAFRRRFISALEALGERALQEGRYDKAERWARRQLANDDLREATWRQLMPVLARRGRRAEALRV
ncbi:MAG: BTAD domain-containing putative transcriptional regulator [Candidatus Promineifilaceae bacterium]|nr:BTAD domain-containing putative transcriptional regulator [Candidatus Promineifilaceae bacterium]